MLFNVPKTFQACCLSSKPFNTYILLGSSEPNRSKHNTLHASRGEPESPHPFSAIPHEYEYLWLFFLLLRSLQLRPPGTTAFCRRPAWAVPCAQHRLCGQSCRHLYPKLLEHVPSPVPPPSLRCRLCPSSRTSPWSATCQRVPLLRRERGQPPGGPRPRLFSTSMLSLDIVPCSLRGSQIASSAGADLREQLPWDVGGTQLHLWS